jgi:cytidine deaminase
MSTKIQGNEFLHINEGTNIEKMLLKYGIEAEKSKIQELRKNLQKTDILTIMIARPI